MLLECHLSGHWAGLSTIALVAVHRPLTACPQPGIVCSARSTQLRKNNSTTGGQWIRGEGRGGEIKVSTFSNSLPCSLVRAVLAHLGAARHCGNAKSGVRTPRFFTLLHVDDSYPSKNSPSKYYGATVTSSFSLLHIPDGGWLP